MGVYASRRFESSRFRHFFIDVKTGAAYAAPYKRGIYICPGVARTAFALWGYHVRKCLKDVDRPLLLPDLQAGKGNNFRISLSPGDAGHRASVRLKPDGNPVPDFDGRCENRASDSFRGGDCR